jgi:hypothetical protein
MVAQPFDAFKEDRMSKYLKVTLLAALAVTLLAALPVVAFAKTTYRTSKPVLSETPSMGKDFSVSGAITPASTSKCRATVKIRLLMQMGSKYDVMDVYTAKLTKMPAGKKGTRYTRTLNIPMMGKHAVQVLQYRGGKLVSKSRIAYFVVQAAADVQQIAVDADSHANVTAPANTPIDVVFQAAAGTMMCARNIGFPACPALVKTSSSPLTYHCDGLPAGTYAWKCSMMDCHFGNLVVE